VIIDVLAPGPSLALYDTTRTPDISICLNRAIAQFPCHYWALQDHQLLAQFKERPSIGYICTPKVKGMVRGETIMLPGPTMQANNWTAPKLLEAIDKHWPEAEFHMFGFDMVGITYYDKTEWLPQRKRSRDVLPARAKDRWEQERERLSPYFGRNDMIWH
jgi:hypothetical protein